MGVYETIKTHVLKELLIEIKKMSIEKEGIEYIQLVEEKIEEIIEETNAETKKDR